MNHYFTLTKIYVIVFLTAIVTMIWLGKELSI